MIPPEMPDMASQSNSPLGDRTEEEQTIVIGQSVLSSARQDVLNQYPILSSKGVKPFYGLTLPMMPKQEFGRASR